jgi:hypothetical protein
MELGKDKDKRLEEKEKWDAEVARSLSVVELKKAHKQIEDVEKLRKRDAVLSIKDRIVSLLSLCQKVTQSIDDVTKGFPQNKVETTPVGDITIKYVKTIVSIYSSIRLDFEKNLDTGKENFVKLFPQLEIDSTNYSMLMASLTCLGLQLGDMLAYSKRLVN